MFVCVCKALRTTEICELIDSGKRTVEEISRSCGAGTDCGSCLGRLQRFLETQEKERSERALATAELKTREAG